MASALQHSRIQEKCMVKTEGLFLKSLLARCVWHQLSVLNLLCSTLAPSHAGYPAGNPGNITSETQTGEEGRGRNTTNSPGTFFLKVILQYLHSSFCFSTSFKMKKSRTTFVCRCQGNKQSQSYEKQEAPSLRKSLQSALWERHHS